MGYKIDSERGIKILRTLSPPITFINGIAETDTIAKQLKKEGFSVMHYDATKAEKTQKFLTRQHSGPIVIEGWIPDISTINSLFGDKLYSYVYIYQNNPKEFWKRSTKSDPKQQSVVKNLLEKQKKTYQEHLNEYEEKILTILV